MTGLVWAAARLCGWSKPGDLACPRCCLPWVPLDFKTSSRKAEKGVLLRLVCAHVEPGSKAVATAAADRTLSTAKQSRNRREGGGAAGGALLDRGRRPGNVSPARGWSWSSVLVKGF